ncbi:SdpI family protein [Patescibacteria group bacterium]|nr:SdpI family protein [Patescibacteria group bacterium]
MNSPLKLSVKSEIWPLLMIAITIGISYYFYPSLPETVASHWDFRGQVDGWTSKQIHSLLLPGIMAGIYILFLILPYFDPKKERYQEFAKVYHIFKSLIITTFLIVYLATTLYNVGYDLNIGLIIASTIGLLMIIIGNYMGKIKKNWFVGIRTPWTLSNENVWNKTHRVGGWMFIIFGLVIILAPNLPANLALYVFISGALLTTLGTFAYSYFAWRQEKKNNPTNDHA